MNLKGQLQAGETVKNRDGYKLMSSDCNLSDSPCQEKRNSLVILV